MVDVESCYIQYEVVCDQFCSRSLSFLNPVTYVFDVSYCCVETTYEISAQS